MRVPAFVLTSLLVLPGARAQDAGPAGDRASPAEPPATTGDADVAVGTEGAVTGDVPVGSAATPESDARHTEALQRFDDAATLFERGDLRGALAEMALVYQLLEGRADQYVVFYNLGRIHEELHRYDRAIELYERYLRESPPDGADRSDAEASLRALERLLGTLVVDVDVAAEVWIGEDLVGEAPGEIRVPAGAHTVELRAAGYEPHRREIEIAARTRLEIDVTLARLSDVHGISPAFFATTMGVALATIAVAIGFGTHALSMRNAGRVCAPLDECGDPMEVTRRISDAALTSDVLGGAGALFAVTSIILAFVTDWAGRAPTSETAPASARVRVRSSVGLGGAALGLEGTF